MQELKKYLIKSLLQNFFSILAPVDATLTQDVKNVLDFASHGLFHLGCQWLLWFEDLELVEQIPPNNIVVRYLLAFVFDLEFFWRSDSNNLSIFVFINGGVVALGRLLAKILGSPDLYLSSLSLDPILQGVLLFIIILLVIVWIVERIVIRFFGHSEWFPITLLHVTTTLIFSIDTILCS